MCLTELKVETTKRLPVGQAIKLGRIGCDCESVSLCESVRVCVTVSHHHLVFLSIVHIAWD
jgi:hypothetical protein